MSDGEWFDGILPVKKLRAPVKLVVFTDNVLGSKHKPQGDFI